MSEAISGIMYDPAATWGAGVTKTLDEQDRDAVGWLIANIRDLAAGDPMWSKNAYTHRRTVHQVFHPLGVKVEGKAPWFCDDVMQAARDTFDHVKAYRKTFKGDVHLVWRREPEVLRENGKVTITVRLCFEPVLVEVSPGVWIEERLTRG